VNMLLIVISICLGVFAGAVLILMTMRTAAENRVRLRLAALDHEFAATDDEAGQITDIRRDRKSLSALPWLNHWLVRMNLASAAGAYLYQAGVSLSLGALLLISLAGAGVLGCVCFFSFRNTLPALFLSAAFVPLPFLYVRMKRARRLARLEEQFPEALGMMVSALRVGHSLVASLGAVARESADPIGGEMRMCFDEQNYGVDLRTALLNLIQRVPLQDFRIFAAAVMIQKESGGNLAEVLEKVAQTIRERFTLKKRVSVHTAQGRMTGWILSLLPIALGVGMYLANPDGMSVLWKRPIGLKMLYTAAGMDIVGALIIRKIVRIRV
jgi:tight adherence protein B